MNAVSVNGYYWSSGVVGGAVRVLGFSATTIDWEDWWVYAWSVRCLQAFTSDLVSRMCSHFHSPFLSSRNEMRDLPLIQYKEDPSHTFGMT